MTLCDFFATMGPMTIQSFEDAERVLYTYVPPFYAQRKVYTLDNMRKLMEHFGNPQESFKVIHIAGTSGKTSTSYYIASMLTAEGKKVGLTVSPHVEGINERAQINMVPLDEAAYVKYFQEFMHALEEGGLRATYFELLIAFAYWVFQKEGVEYAVIEVGLGGLLDATNVVMRPDKVCVITDIGQDHTEVLGKTTAEIVAQKAGIIRPHNTVVMYDQGEEIMSVAREICEQQHAELHEIWPLKPKDLPVSLPLFQRRNWYLALSVFNCLVERDGVEPLDQQQLAASSQVQVPARMEMIMRAGKTTVMDGAHNAQKMVALAQSMMERFPGSTMTIVLALVRSKNFKVRTRLEAITGIADRIIITSFEGTQDLMRECVDPAKIAEYLHLKGFSGWEIVADPVEAYKTALQGDSDVVLVTGSFYLIDEIRPYILNKKV